MKTLRTVMLRFITRVLVFFGAAMILLSLNPSIMQPYWEALGDFTRPYFEQAATPIAELLRQPGAQLRAWVLQVPMLVAKSLFYLYFTLILLWVLLKKPEDVRGYLPGREKPFDLRPLVCVSIVSLYVIYGIF